MIGFFGDKHQHLKRDLDGVVLPQRNSRLVGFLNLAVRPWLNFGDNPGRRRIYFEAKYTQSGTVASPINSSSVSSVHLTAHHPGPPPTMAYEIVP